MYSLSPVFCFLLNIVLVKFVAAFGTELRRICRVFGFPAALVAAVQGNSSRLGFSAFCAEFTLVDCSAGTSPALRRLRRFRISALRTEFCRIYGTAGTGPAVSGSRLLHRLCLSNMSNMRDRKSVV